MKQHHSMLGRRFGTATFVVALITACANGDSAVDEDGGLDAAKKDGQGLDTGVKPDTGVSMCSSCNIDLDCQNTCGAPPNGMTWCCDGTMNSCYPAQQCSGGQDGGSD